MTYEEIVAKAKEEFGSADVSSYEGHLALQINVTGEGEGIFYAEILDGKLFIEPFDYKDNDAVLTADGKDILNLFNGTLDPAEAFESGKLTVTGDIAKALSIQPIIEKNKKSAKKTAKKPAAKTTAKTAAKTTAKAAARTASKTTAKTTKAAAKTTKAAAKKEEAPAIIGLAEPKKAPAKSAAPKAAAKKTTAKAAKESTKPAKTASKTTAKKG